jgi:hypothetical protein
MPNNGRIAAFGLLVIVCLGLTSANAYVRQAASSAATGMKARFDSETEKGKLGDVDRARLRERIADLKHKLDSSGKKAASIDAPIALGSKIKDYLTAAGLRVTDCSFPPSGAPFSLALDVQGDPSALALLFWEEASGRAPFTIASMDIGAAEAPDALRAGLSIFMQKRTSGIARAQASSLDLGRLFKPGLAGKAQLPAKTSVSAHAQKIAGTAAGATSAKPLPAPWLDYVGKAESANGRLSYFLKDTRERKMLELAMRRADAAVNARDDALISEGIESLIVQYKGVRYEIKK